MTPIRARDALLAETEWLRARLDDPRVRIVDIRGLPNAPSVSSPYLPNRDAYRVGHIPGAVFVDWTEDIVEPHARIRMTMAGPRRFRDLVERLGIGDEHTVVVYDDSGIYAPRLWWMFGYYGHRAVKVLNGGWAKWVREGWPVSREVLTYPHATFTPQIQPGWRIARAEVRSQLGDPGVALIDCRSQQDWAGITGRGQRKGRIPGAVNVPWNTCLDSETQTWKGPMELAQLFERAGVGPGSRAVTYCNAGFASSTGSMALTMLGYPHAVNFAGSWYEWESDPASPVAVGP